MARSASADAGVGRVERYLRDPAREMIALLRAQFREAVIDHADEFIDLLRALSEVFDRRLRVGQDLRIVLVAVDDLLAGVEVVERRDRPHALAHVLILTGNLEHLVEEFLREKVCVGVDPHAESSETESYCPPAFIRVDNGIFGGRYSAQ